MFFAWPFTYLPQWTLEQVKQTQGLLLDLHTLQHQDDGEPLGNLAESGAMQTLELRCGHSMATRTAAGTAEALGRRDFRGSVWGRF